MDENRLKARWQREDAEAIDAAVSAMLAQPQTRKLLWWLLQIGKVGMQPYAHNALQTSFNCGELNVGQQILDRITSVSPEGYVALMKEQADERTERARQLADARADTDPYADSDSGADARA